jgi:hypothetical protein
LHAHVVDDAIFKLDFLVCKFAAVAAVAGLSAMGLVVVAAVIESKIEQRRDPEGFKAQLEAEALETLNELREGAE